MSKYKFSHTPNEKNKHYPTHIKYLMQFDTDNFLNLLRQQ